MCGSWHHPGGLYESGLLIRLRGARAVVQTRRGVPRYIAAGEGGGQVPPEEVFETPAALAHDCGMVSGEVAVLAGVGDDIEEPDVLVRPLTVHDVIPLPVPHAGVGAPPGNHVVTTGPRRGHRRAGHGLTPGRANQRPHTAAGQRRRGVVPLRPGDVEHVQRGGQNVVALDEGRQVLTASDYRRDGVPAS